MVNAGRTSPTRETRFCFKQDHPYMEPCVCSFFKSLNRHSQASSLALMPRDLPRLTCYKSARFTLRCAQGFLQRQGSHSEDEIPRSVAV
jgi:hypothetical protein